MENTSGRQQPGDRPGTDAGHQGAGIGAGASGTNRGTTGAGASGTTGTGPGGMSGAGAGSLGARDRDIGTGGSVGSSGMQASGSGVPGTRHESSTDEGTVDRARRFASETRLKATEKTRERLAVQKSRAAESLGIVAESLRSSGDRLRERHEDGVSRMFSSVADQIERFADTLEGRDVNEMLREAERFARRQPAVFLGGAFAIGLMAARFFKASERNLEEEEDRGRTRGSHAGGAYDAEAYRGAEDRGFRSDREVPSTPVVDAPPADANARSTTTGPSREIGR